MSQSHDLLEYLRAGGSLTVLEAINKFGCYALSQRLGELRRCGYLIEDKFITTTTDKKIKRYWMPRGFSSSGAKGPVKDLFPDRTNRQYSEYGK